MANRRKVGEWHNLFVAIERKVHETLRTIAFNERCSLADLVREAIDTLISERQGPKQPAGEGRVTMFTSLPTSLFEALEAAAITQGVTVDRLVVDALTALDEQQPPVDPPMIEGEKRRTIFVQIGVDLYEKLRRIGFYARRPQASLVRAAIVARLAP